MQVSESVRERQGDSAEPKLPKLVSQGDLLGLKDQLVQQAGVIIVWNYVSGGESCTTSPLIECFMECGPLKGRLIKFNRNKCSLLGMSLQKADLLYVFKQNDLVFCDVAGSFLQSIFKPLKLGQISFAEVFATEGCTCPSSSRSIGSRSVRRTWTPATRCPAAASRSIQSAPFSTSARAGPLYMDYWTEDTTAPPSSELGPAEPGIATTPAGTTPASSTGSANAA